MDQKNNEKDIEARKLIAQIQSGDTEVEAHLVDPSFGIIPRRRSPTSVLR